MENVVLMLRTQKDSLLYKTAVSDSGGIFEFNAVAAGNYYLEGSYLKTKSMLKNDIEVQGNAQHIELGVINFIQITGSDVVTVTGSRPLIERKIDKVVYNLNNSIIASGNTAWDVLRTAPGVNTDNQGNVSIRAGKTAAVMIDDKLVAFSGDDLVNYLRSLNAEEISRIEIIKNPSAKYQAEGTGGIVNIITKKTIAGRKPYGTFTAGYEQNTYPKFNTGINYNYQAGKFIFYLNYGLRTGLMYTGEYLDQEFSSGGNTVYFSELLKRKRDFITHTYKTDIRWLPNKKTTIGLQADGNIMNRTNDDVSLTPISGITAQPDSFYRSVINIDGRSRYFSANISLKMLLDSARQTSLSANSDYLYYYARNNSFNTNDFLDSEFSKMRPTTYFGIRAPQQINIYTTAIDFTTQPAPGKTFDAGVKINRTKTDNNFLFKNIVNGAGVSDTAKSNHFLYSENVSAAYLNYSRAFKKITVQAGLRGELTQTTANLVTTKSEVERSYFTIFPTAYFEYRAGDNYTLSFSYGRRLRRPSYAHLNPFRYYATPYAYSEGNPFLRPAYSHSLDLTQVFRNKYSLMFYYAHYKGEILQLPEQDPVNRTIAFRRLNIENSYAYGIFAEGPVTVAKWWQLYVSADLSVQGVNSAYLNGRAEYKKMAIDVNLNQSFTISARKMWSAESGFSYRSPRYGGIFLLGNYSELYAGIKKTFPGKRLSIALNFSDIFRGTLMPAEVSYLGQKSTAKTDNDIRGVRLSLAYKFGSLSNKQIKERVTSNKDERGRIR